MPLNFANGSKNVSKELLLRIAEEAFSFLGRGLQVGLKFVSNEEIRRLNLEYRQMDKVTNVLSFADDEGGDIVLCDDFIAEEAAALGFSAPDLTALYLVHGILHLAGYDHENDRGRVRMEEAEAKILSRFGIIIER